MNIKVEKSVPMPVTRRGVKAKYPWESMNIGESFLAKGVNGRSFRSQAAVAGRLHRRKFTCRNVEGGIRVWRTA